MRRVVRAYAHRSSPWFEALRKGVKDANGLQTEFEFQLGHLIRKAFTGANGEIDISRLEKEPGASSSRGLILCNGSFSNRESLVEKLPNRVYLSPDLKLGSSPNDPSPRVFILYQLIAAALTVGVKLSEQANDLMTHHQPIGCLWDWWRNANERSATMLAARVCPRCEEILRRHGDVGDSSLRAAQQMLNYVRRTILAGSSRVPDRILIAHGHGADWTLLARMLKKWNLPVDSFERQPTAGRLVTERWQEMLNNARLAFAVMTPDDRGATDEAKQARQNVIHEIGLCHARLGLFDTIVLIAKGTANFSNMEGVVSIRFQEGRLDAQRKKIKDCLKLRGIL